MTICRTFEFVVLTAGSLGIAACSPSQLGPCQIIYEEALITIVRAEDAATHAPVPRVSIRSISRDQQPIADPGVLTRVGAPVRGTTINGSELVCEVVCSFGVQEGTYRMSLSASGYRDTTITVQAKYARNNSASGGCPVRASGGIRLAIGFIAA